VIPQLVCLLVSSCVHVCVCVCVCVCVRACVRVFHYKQHMCDGGQKVQLLEMYLVDMYRMKNGNLGG